MPRRMQVDFSRKVQELADSSSKELDSSDIWNAFVDYYHLDNSGHFQLVDFQVKQGDNGYAIIGKIKAGDNIHEVEGHGNGLISSIIDALSSITNIRLEVVDIKNTPLATVIQRKRLPILNAACRRVEPSSVLVLTTISLLLRFGLS